MVKHFIGLVLGVGCLSASGVVVPDAYKIMDDKELSYVYSEEYTEVLADLKLYHEQIIDGYEKEYGYKLDEKLHVGLASHNNQIANAFSTQIPFNAQLFYGAGAGSIDYFCFSSWLKTLLIHETAHNFQLNPKENELSRLSHKVLGNNPFSIVGLLPVFPLPNITESSFMLEGNSVMNESRYGNGGRLFSGYALAEVVTLAKAGKIRPEMMYNNTLSFPYGEKPYLVGGFFQQFLVERYGIEKVNGYFKTYATQPYPFFTNRIFKEQFGKDFEVLLSTFAKEIQTKHQGFVSTQGEVLAKSQIFVPLNADENIIYTLVGDKKSGPKVLEINRENKKVSYVHGSWRVGEVFKYRGNYAIQSSAKTSPTNIEMGLYDADGYLLKETGSKVMQGFKHNGAMVYIDVPKSLESPQVYVDGTFYTQSHSSVYVDREDNLYYFKQEGKKRTLYKNKTALFDYEGHYGFVSDVDVEGNVYFIASSEHGSTAYRFAGGKLERVTQGDDVIEFKYVNEKEALVTTIGAEGYSYRVVTLENGRIDDNRPHKVEIEDGGRLSSTLQVLNFAKSSEPLESKPYRPFQELHYSALSQAMSYEDYEGFGMGVQANFSDPLMQNSLSVLLSSNKQRTVAGVRYNNQAHQLEYGVALYGVNHDAFDSNERNHGYDAYVHLPFLARGYWRASSTLAYTKAYDNIYREPLTLSFDIENRKQYGLSKYANHLNELSFFTSSDRDNTIVGASYAWMHDMPFQSYVGLKGAYLKSDKVSLFDEKGIELGDTFSSLQSDRATLNIPTFSSTTYAQEVKMAELSLAKVFDASLYFYSFPFSLQRESLYLKQRIYDIDFSTTLHREYKETIAGLELDLLFLHKLQIPLSVEWLYNADAQDKEYIRVLLGMRF
ncbi:hypothetical protein KKC13_07340 [bacterium]|nr:hypothetical protein [bacterium]MBU1958422.1 hypothetical protein [bacterium]